MMPGTSNADIMRELGSLTTSVANLTKTVEKLEAQVDGLTAERNRGLGIIAALTIVAGVIGAKASAVFGAIFGGP